MKLIVIAVIISVLFCGFLIPYILRAFARVRADQTIYGHRPATEKLLRRCIAILTWSNRWITNHEEMDDRRIWKLHVLLDEMQTPHG